jgi:hypothetical protein
MSRQWVYPGSGACKFCDGPASVHLGNLALIMVDPEGTVHGFVCGGCLTDGTYLRWAVMAWLVTGPADTPEDAPVHGGGDVNS